MRNLVMTAVATALTIALQSCGPKDVHRIAGDIAVETGFEASKYKDTDNEYYAIVLGEHGDEMEARSIAMAEASLQFAAKSEAITDAAMKQIAGSNMGNRAGEKNLEAIRTVLNKAVVNNMRIVKDKLFMNPDKGTYKYRVLLVIDVDDVIKNVREDIAYTLTDN